MSSVLTLPVPGQESIMLRERLRGYWRHRKSALYAFGAAALLTVALALLLPATYQSGATILIEQQEIPQELVRSAVTSFADQRVQVISQRVMSTQNLLSLIERYNLYPDLRQSKPREVLMQKMRDDIAMKMISADVIDPRSGRPTQATIAFGVSYKSRSAELAVKVANELTTLYLNENLTSRTQMAQQTATFFSEEAARQQARIAEIDKKLSEFKQKHADRLPELTQLNMSVSERTELELRDEENRMGSLDAQRVLLEAQLAQINPTSQFYSDTGQRVLNAEDRLKSLRSLLAGYKARYSPGHPDIVNTEREIEGLQKQVKSDDATSEVTRQLDDRKAELAQAKEKYSPDHPDVLRLTRIVAELEKTVAASPPASAKRREDEHADNPAYIQVKGQLDALKVERERSERKRDELRAKLEDYERRLAQTPIVEREYRELVRDLESAQLKYQEIKAKQSEVQVSQNLETERKGERFTLIEPPLPPEKPISPNRTLILAMGMVLSIGAGIGVAIMRNSLDASVRGAGDLRLLLSVPPLAAIPVIVTDEELQQRTRTRRRRWVIVAAGLIAALLLVHFFVRPLDVFWASLLRRFGG